MRNHRLSSPLGTPRNVQSPTIDSGDEGSLRIERGTYQYMFQDIVSIKSMLLKLKRVLQEAETAAPFHNSVKNGVFYNVNEGGTADVSTSPDKSENIVDELADLRRQVIFLQGQLEDKDRTIQGLQLKMSKLQGPNGTENQGKGHGFPVSVNNSSPTDTSNAATQTEKMRTTSAGPSLLHSLPQDGNVTPLVSWSDSWDKRRASETGSRKSTDPKARQNVTSKRPVGCKERPSLENPSKNSCRTSTLARNARNYENIKKINSPLVLSQKSRTIRN